MVLKTGGTKSRGSLGERIQSEQLDPDSSMRDKIIDFEGAKWALYRGGQTDGQRPVNAGGWSRLPDLALEDWFDWTALCVLFGAVALFPFLAMIFC